MRVIGFLCILCVLVVILPAVAAFTRDEAISLVNKEVIGKSLNKYVLHAYVWPFKVEAVRELYNTPLKFDAPVWFFWIDDMPEMQFAHSNRYVFVYDDGFYQIMGGEWYPDDLSRAELFYVGRPPLFDRILSFLRRLL